MDITKVTIGFYCSSTSWGGLEMNFVRHALWLKEKGCRIEAFCVVDTPIYKALIEAGMTPIVVLKNKKYFDFSNAAKVKKLLLKHSVEILWITDNRDMSLVYLLKSFYRLKLKVIYRQAMRMGVKKKDIIHTNRFKAIDYWISTLDYMADEVLAQTNVPKERIRVIPLGLELDTLHKDGLDKESVRKNFGWPIEKTILGLIGRIDPHKGQLFILQQIPELLKEYPQIHLAIVGEPTRNEGDDYLNEIKAFIKTNELENSVSLHAFLKEKELFYKGVDIVVVSSAAETFGMVTIEAMAHGCAIIGTNTAGTGELLGQGEFGVTYTPNDSEDFIVNLRKLMDAQTRNVLGGKAIEEAKLRYSKESFCKSILEMIQSA